MTDTETALRDALTAVAEALDVPAGQQHLRSDRAIMAERMIRYMLAAEDGAELGTYVRTLRESVTAAGMEAREC